MGRVQRMMAAAGYHGEWPAIVFVAVQLALPALVFATGVYLFGRGTPMVFSGIAAVAAYLVPNFWLGHQVEQRRTLIRNGLPDAIDLLIVCIEAGSGIDQALARVAEELAIAYPALARELDMVCAEMRAGKPRMDAFKNFAERTKVDDVRSLVAMLVQTDRFGTSLGQALRTHADTSRTKRRQRAEEKAAKLGVKLLFPLVFCLFPAFYLVVLGPSVLRIFRQMIWANVGP
jgi:tight adherence protein C